MVEWLFKNPLSDGGQFTGISDILGKYGVVPSDVMVETNSSESTGRMANLIGLKLKEFGLQLRDQSAKGAKVAALEKNKTEMLGTIYRMLVLNLGEPPTKFTWTRKDAKGNPVSDVNDAVGFDLSHSKTWTSMKGLPKEGVILGFSNITESKDMPIQFVEYLQFE